MKLMLGNELSPDDLMKWIECVNRELNRSDRNQACFDFITKISDYSIFVMDDKFYAVLLPAPNLWGDLELQVVSCYVLPEYRNFKRWVFLQKTIERIAIELGCVSIIQGSHFGDDRIYDFWKRRGYELCEVKKKIG